MSASHRPRLPQLSRFRHLASTALLAIILAVVGCDRMSSTLPTDDSPIVLALGDSITAGKTLDKSLHYPALLQAKFTAAGINARFYNAGFAGDISARAEPRAIELLAFHPVMMIIALGTNDITGKTTPEEAERSLAAAIEAMQAADVAVFLIGSQVQRVSAARLEGYADMYRRLATRYDIPLVLDILAPVSNNPELIRSDNIHPTAAGQQAIADALYEPIRRALKQTLEGRKKERAAAQN